MKKSINSPSPGYNTRAVLKASFENEMEQLGMTGEVKQLNNFKTRLQSRSMEREERKMYETANVNKMTGDDDLVMQEEDDEAGL